MKNSMVTATIRLLSVCLTVSVLALSTCKKDDNSDIDLANQTKSITYLTEHYPPLNYEQEGELHGVSVDLLEALFDKMNVGLSRKDVTLKNWAEAYQQTLNEERTMLFSTARLPGRESLFKWVGPIAPEKNIVVGMTASHIVISSTTDLNNYKLGVIEDYAAILFLLDQGVQAGTFVKFDDVGQLYNALITGGVDCIIYSELGNKLIIESMGLNAEDFETLFMPKVTENYFAFHVNTPEGLIVHFQQTLDKVKLDKTEDGSSVYEKILSKYHIIQHIDDQITPEMVISLVELTAAHIASDAPGTFQKMNQQLAPYKDPDNPALYSFAYDTTVTMVAHADNLLLVGVSFRGKTDAAGKKFRDEIVAGALEHQTGWTDYIYTKPDQSGLYYKTTYYQLVTGSDGKLYIVCAGRFK